MPERAFVYQTVETLKKTAAALERALQTGSVTDLQLSGIRTSHTPLTPDRVALMYLQCRYEIYAHGLGLHGFLADEQAATLEAKNPYGERVMRVETRYPG
jgi:hypothetical protein